MNPIGEYSLVDASELSRSRENPAAIDEHRETICRAVLEGKLLARQFRRTVQRYGCAGRKGLVDPFQAEAMRVWHPGIGGEGVVFDAHRKRGERGDRVDAARAQKHERRLTRTAELEDVHRSKQVVLDE